MKGNGPEIAIFGVRGSIPISHPDYLEFGGNSASYTLRTPNNTLVFLDAGTGIKFATRELNSLINDIWIIFSHTHADHIYGLGMCELPYLSMISGFEEKIVNLVGPKGFLKGLDKFYDGNSIWPVKLTKSHDKTPSMTSLDLAGAKECTGGEIIPVDSSTTIHTLKGNHPGESGVLLYKFVIRHDEKTTTVVYATDNEFDYVDLNQANPNAEEFKEKYKTFIENADLLIADAQYLKDDYEMYKGFGHSYPEQIASLALASNVKRLLITHHHNYVDATLKRAESSLQDFVGSMRSNMQVNYAREGMRIEL